MCTRNYESKKIKTIYLAACSSKYEYREGDSTPFFISWPNSETIDSCSRDISLCLVCWSANLPAIFFSYNKLVPATSHSQPKRVNKMQGLRRMSTDAELLQFVNLWSKLQYIQLTTTEDTIIWRFTTSRKYSASSAYKIQRKVSYPDQKWDQIWNVKVEPECSFFYFFRDRA